MTIVAEILNTLALARQGILVNKQVMSLMLASLSETLQTITDKYVPKALRSRVAIGLEDQVTRLSSSSTGFFSLL